MDGEAKYSADEAKTWEAQVASALKFRAKFGREDRWRRYVKRLAHVWSTSHVAEESPTVNILAARIRALVPQLAIGMPSVKVTALVKPSDINSEPALQQRLESSWSQERMDEETRRVTLDVETFGIGCGFVGYETSWGDQVVGRQKRAFGVLPPALTDKLSAATNGLTDAVSTETEETVPQLLTERWFLERVSPLNLILDPTADHVNNAAFMGRRLFMTEKEAERWFGKKAPKADSVGNIASWDSADESDPLTTSEPNDLKSAIDVRIQRVVVYELWDIATAKTVYLNRSGKVILARDWASPYAGFPFAFMLWDEIPDSVYPEGMAAALEPLNNELHVIRKRELQALRQAIRKYTSRGPVSQKARLGLQSTEDGEIIEMSDYDSIEPLQFQPIPPDMFSVENRVKADMDEVSATSPGLALGQGPIRKTATESAFIQGAADAMIGYRQLMVERFAGRVLEIGLSIITSVFDEPTPIKIINADPEKIDDATGEPLPVGDAIEYVFVGVEHAGYYKVSVQPDSMVASSKDVERSQNLEVFDRLKDEPWFDRQAFGIHILSGLPSVRDVSNFIVKQQPQPEQQPQPAPQPGMPGLPPELAGMMGGMGQQQMSPEPSGMGMVNPTAEGDLMSAVYGGAAPQGGV